MRRFINENKGIISSFEIKINSRGEVEMRSFKSRREKNIFPSFLNLSYPSCTSLLISQDKEESWKGTRNFLCLQNHPLNIFM